MKLRTKIAGTLALPLALAVAANVNAAQITDELKIGGFVAATANWAMYDKTGQDSDVDFGLSLGVSRINVAYTKNGVTYLYENDWNGGGKGTGDEYRLRHAAVMYDGWVAGYTWSGFANLTGLAETIDSRGPTTYSANANRTAKLGKTLTVADGMSVGIFIEDHGHALNSDGTTKNQKVVKYETFDTTTFDVDEASTKVNSAIPDVVLNFNGDFGATKVFAAARLVNVNDTKTKDVDLPWPDTYKAIDGKAKTKIAADFAVGVSQNLIDDNLNLKLAVLSLDKSEKNPGIRSKDGRDLGVQVGVQYKINDQIRTNLVVEQVMRDAKDADSTGIWLNGFYKLDNGWEWGAEFVSVSTDKNANGVTDISLGDKDMRVSLLAKYAF